MRDILDCKGSQLHVRAANPRSAFAPPTSTLSTLSNRSMHPPVPILKTIAFIAASLLAAPGASAQSKGVIDCTPGGHGPDCQVKLATGQRSVLVHFRPTITLPAGTVLNFNVQGTHILRQVSLGADNTGQFPWSSPTPPTDTLLILVQTTGVPIVQNDTIRIVPAAAPARVVMPQENLAPYVWLRNSWVPTPLRVGVAPQTGDALTEKECRSNPLLASSHS